MVSQIKMEENTSPSSVVVIAGYVSVAVGVEQCLWDLLSILIDVYIDGFPWFRVGQEREVDSPCSTEAGHKIASVDINTWRISLQTKLAGVEQFVVRDHGLFSIMVGRFDISYPPF